MLTVENIMEMREPLAYPACTQLPGGGGLLSEENKEAAQELTEEQRKNLLEIS